MDFYEAPVREGERHLRQGDLLSPIPFVTFSVTEAFVLTPSDEAPLRRDLTRVTDLPPGAQVLSNVLMGTGIVLNQSSDLIGQPGRAKPILLARVVAASERVKDFKIGPDLKKIISQVRALANPGKTPSLFYLPEYEDEDFHLARSVADLLEVVHFPPSNLGPLSGLVRLRLSPHALQALQERIAYCFGRFGAPDHLYFSPEEWEQASS
jgi:hypothetical protein